MTVLALLAFVSAVLVALAVGLFAWTVRDGTFDHGDHLSLLPLRGDATESSVAPKNAPDAPSASVASRGERAARVSRGEAVGTEHGFEADEQ